MPHPPMPTVPHPLHMAAERGGHATCAPATNAQERAQQCTLAWALSRHFDGDAVRVRDYLPGLHLDIRATRALQCLELSTIQQEDLDWDSVEELLQGELHRPARRPTLWSVNLVMHCAIYIGGAPYDPPHPVAFTLQCRWPGALGGWRR